MYNISKVACVAPTKASMEPTMNTLRYATQLKNMKAVVSQKAVKEERDEIEDEVGDNETIQCSLKKKYHGRRRKLRKISRKYKHL